MSKEPARRAPKAVPFGPARVFDEMFDFPLLGGRGPDALRADIKESAKTVEVSVALPGVEKKDISLELTEHSLSVTCERRQERREELPGTYSLREQSYGRFYRSFALPAPVRTAGARAACRDGVLRVTLQKKAGAGGRSSRVRVE